MTFSQCVIFRTPVIALERTHDEIFLANDFPNLRRFAMNKFGAQLNWNGHRGIVNGKNPTA